jgi:hypothetical protein
MTRRPQNRRYQGYHPKAGLIDFVEQADGTSWGLYLVGIGPKGLKNLKLAAFGAVQRKANYWLTFNGTRITRRNDGLDLLEKTPGLAALVLKALCDNGHCDLSQVRKQGAAPGTGAATTPTIRSRAVVAPLTGAGSAQNANDGSDLI